MEKKMSNIRILKRKIEFLKNSKNPVFRGSASIIEKFINNNM